MNIDNTFVNPDYSVYDALDLIISKVNVMRKRCDIAEYVYDDLIESLYEFRSLLCENKVSSAIPLYKICDSIFDSVFLSDYNEGDFV